MQPDTNPESRAKSARGRGITSNLGGRFEPYAREAVDDGWGLDDELPVVRTEVAEEIVRKVMVKNASPDLSFDRAINLYRGCEHGCAYCFARPTHAYLGLSAGLDFETKLIARPNAAIALKRELAAKAYRAKPIAIGTNTDPYQPIEARYRLMSQVLGVLNDHNHPVVITTKGCLIERDIDVLRAMAKRNLVQVGISVTSLDRKLSRKLEPRAPAPARRLLTIQRLSAAGIPVRVMVAPVIPGLSDHELEAILAQSAQAGAKAASWIMLRLPAETLPLMQEWMRAHYPNKAAKVFARLKEMHGGKAYDADFGSRMRGSGPYSSLIAHRFRLAARSNGLDTEMPKLDTSSFAVPGRAVQYSLFD